MSNDFDAAVAASLQPNPAQAARAGFALAADTNPDSYVEARRVARRTGVPVDTVLNMPAEMARQDAVGSIDFDALARTAPATAALLADVERAKVAHDDVHPLSSVERAVRQLGGGGVEGVGMAVGGLGQLADIAQRNATNAFAGAFLPKPRAAGVLTPEALAAPTLGEDWIRAGGAVKGYARGDIMVPAAQQTFFDQVMGGLGQLGGQVGMHVATGGTLSLPLLFAQGADAMAEKVAPDQAGAGARDAAILGGAAVTGITEKWALDKLLGPMAVPIKNQLGAALARIGIGAVTEGGQEFSENLLQDVLRKALTNRDAEIDLGQSAEEGGVGAAVGGIARSIVEAALHVRSRGARREQQAQAAERQAQALQALSDLAATSKLRQRDPDSFEKFVQEAAESRPVQDVFISAETLAQSGLAEQVAAVSPAVAEQLQTALQTGGDIRIPVGEYGARVAPVPALAQPLLDHLKTDPDGLTRGEGRALKEREADRFAEEVDRALQDRAAETSFAAQGQAIEQELAAQLDAAGRFSPTVNKVYAQLPRAFFETMAQRLGITPQELFQRYPLRLTAERILSERQALEQQDRERLHAVITGAEFGETDLPVKELRQAARAWYDANLRDTPVTNRGSGREVLFGRGGKAFATAANAEKVRLFAALPALIESGQILSSTPPSNPAKESNVKAYHWLEGNVQLGDRVVRVGVTLREDNRGSLYYNHNPIDGMKPPGSAELGDTAHKAGAGTGEAGAYEQSLSPDDINLYVLEQGARATFSPSTSTIALLKDANLSSFLHESGHAFLEFTFDMAARLESAQRGGGALSEGELQVLADANALLRWFGVENLTAWYSMDFEQRRVHHERFAEGFEHHLFSGQAPSLELQPVFQRFRAWLLDVYKSLKSFLERHPEAGELSDEVRGVFDRMLATEQQIQEAQRARGLAPLFTTAEEAAAFGVDWSGYQALGSEATDDAAATLERRSVRDMTWTARLREKTLSRLNREALDLRKAMRREVEAEVASQPVYQVQRWLKTGILPDGTQTVGAKLNTTALAEMYGDGPATPRRYLPTNLLAADGLHPDVVAGMFLNEDGSPAFSSGDALVRAIVEAGPFRQTVDALTDVRMLERHGDITSPEALARAADEAIHNDVRLRFLATELAALQQAMGGARALAQMATEYGARLVEKAPSGKLRPTQYAAAAARAGKAAEEALKKGDRQEAVRQKRFQLINLAATRAAYDAQAELQKTATFFRKVASASTEAAAKSRNLDIVNVARAILAEHGVGMRGKDPAAYLEAVQAYDANLFSVVEPMLLEARQNARPLEQMNVGEVRALRDTVESLWFLARRERQAEIDGQLVDREQIEEALAARLEELGVPETIPGEGRAVTQGEKMVRMLMGVRAALRRVESWVDRMDSGKIDGAFRRYLYTPISEAADRYRADAGAYLRRYRDLLKAIEPTLTAGRIEAPELGYTFGHSKGDAGKAELLHALLHTGNESNRRKLLLGRGWATESAEGVLDTTRWDRFVARMIAEGKLTKADFDFAQGVWDLLEETKPLAQATHRQVFGRYFDEVAADEFTVRLQDGTSATYRGGYVPAIYDPFIVQDAAVNAELDASAQGNAFMFPATNRGFTRGRVEYNKPLALDLRLLPQHIDKVLLFAHLEAPVRDVLRTLRAKGVSGPLSRYDPVAYTDLLLPYLNRAATQTVETPATGWAGKLTDRFFRTVRSRAGVAAMFANVVNALQQAAGVFTAGVKVRPTLLMAATWRYMRNPTGVAEEVAELSPFMATRMHSDVMEMRQQIEELLLNPNAYEKTQAWTSKHAYFLQSAFQNMVDTITWAGAYDQAVAEGLSEADAIRSANSAVRETQGSLSPEDISRFESGTAFARLFTQFGSYFNMLANLQGTEFAKVAQDMGLRKGAGRLFYVFLMGFLAQAWISEAIVQLSRGGFHDDDGDGYLDEFLAFFFGAPARSALAMVPVVGQAATVVWNSFNRKPYDDRMSTAPAISMIESAAQAPHSVYAAIAENGKASRAIRDTLTLVTLTTGAPASVLSRPLGYAADVMQGRVEPTGPLDAARGAVTGVASPDSKR